MAKMNQLSNARLLEIIDKACKGFEGDGSVLESAIGALVLSREFGWHGTRVMHSRVTFNRYESILGIKFRECVGPRGPESHRLAGIRFIDKIGKFWQAISSGLISAKKAARVALG